MDTDVEVCRNLDPLLGMPAFSGFESDDRIPTGTMGAEKENPWIALLLSDYENISFIRPNGTMDLQTNTARITETTLKNYQIALEGKIIETKDFTMLPFDYLCAKSWESGEIHKTENTYTIHHFANSWQSDKAKAYGNFRRRIKKSRNPICRMLDVLLDKIVKLAKGK